MLSFKFGLCHSIINDSNSKPWLNFIVFTLFIVNFLNLRIIIIKHFMIMMRIVILILIARVSFMK